MSQSQLTHFSGSLKCQTAVRPLAPVIDPLSIHAHVADACFNLAHTTAVRRSEKRCRCFLLSKAYGSLLLADASYGFPRSLFILHPRCAQVMTKISRRVCLTNNTTSPSFRHMSCNRCAYSRVSLCTRQLPLYTDMDIQRSLGSCVPPVCLPC